MPNTGNYLPENEKEKQPSRNLRCAEKEASPNPQVDLINHQNEEAHSWDDSSVLSHDSSFSSDCFSNSSNDAAQSSDIESSEIDFKSASNDRYLPNCTWFQLRVEQIRSNHRADQQVFNELMDLVKEFSSGSQLSFNSNELVDRREFLVGLESTFNTKKLKPSHVKVKLSDGTVGTVSVFDLEAQIVSLLTNPDLMKEEHLAPGLDIFSGKEIGESDSFGEIHTGTAWATAVAQHVVEGSDEMPVGIILYGDKSHFDTHGGLCVTPMSFTLSIFSRNTRNSMKFWRPMVYLPNLSENTLDDNDDDSVMDNLDPITSEDSVKDEQKCLAIALESLKSLHRQDGFFTTVMGHKVKIRVWIHFISGDTQGNNRWLGHFNGSGKLAMPWRNCRCPYADMNKVDPDCVFIRPADVALCI